MKSFSPLLLLLLASQAYSANADVLVREVLDNRCVVCHACYDAPCQLKLDSFEGILRGAHKSPVYDATRINETHPTRLYVDGSTTADWRALGFFPVVGDNSNNALAALIDLKAENPPQARAPLPDAFPLAIDRQLSCPATDEALQAHMRESGEQGMPYGMAPLPPAELSILRRWIEAGAPSGTQPEPLPASVSRSVASFEIFMNKPEKRNQLVARYLYEHWFQGYLSIVHGGTPHYFKLIRSSTPPGEAPVDIGTRHPNDPPGGEFHYRLRRVQSTLVDKTLFDYRLSPAKLRHLEDLFLGGNWKVSKLPGYGEGWSNPFKTFKDIPAASRYQFLLEDAGYFLTTFIKGPVCRGQVALNVIDDHFFVGFLSPDYDLSIQNDRYLHEGVDLLALPRKFATTIDFTQEWHERWHEHRKYLAYRNQNYEKHKRYRRGLSRQAIWSGADNFTNVFTVFRNFDSATILPGIVGSGSRKAWIIDFPVLERIYYNLVVNYDVYGNASHQILTRLYMDYLRMEAEGLFISLLPSRDREDVLRSWYEGWVAELKVFYAHSGLILPLPTQLRFNSQDKPAEFIRLLATVSKADTKIASPGEPYAALSGLQTTQSESLRYLPELSLIATYKGSSLKTVTSLLLNKSHSNISFIFGEENRRRPERDYLTVYQGIAGSYPNFIFAVQEDEQQVFIDMVKMTDNKESFTRLIARFGVRRTDPRIWPTLDDLHDYKTAALRSEGLLDIGRYENF